VTCGVLAYMLISFLSAVYGTCHVFVLDGFQPSTTIADLERLFEDFKDRGFSIRWINDTLALAVFQSPSIGMCNWLVQYGSYICETCSLVSYTLCAVS